jgi:putative transposase
VLVLLGVRADGRKELIALDSGYRESGESSANVLRDACGCRKPMRRAGIREVDLRRGRLGSRG